MALACLGNFILNFACVVFLLVRLKLVLPLLNSCLSPWRRWRGYKGDAHLEANGLEIALNMCFVMEENLTQRIRGGMAMFLAMNALLLTTYLPWAPWMCLGAFGWDVASLLLSPKQPEGDFLWRQDRHGMVYGMQGGHCGKHMLFTGGISLSCYTCGVLQFIFDRFGTEGFEDTDFSGASSGSWAALTGLLATHGAGNMQQVYKQSVVSAVALVHLFPFPFSMLLPGCQAVETFSTVSIELARIQAPKAYRAITEEGKLVIWLFAFSLRRSFSRCYRLALRRGPDFESARRLGALMAATSVFPYFTSPRLCSPLQCLPAVMDGWFPGKGSGMLPVPDMTVPCVGNTLLFDVSGGMQQAHAGDKRIHVLDIRSWEDFSVRDLTACSPEAVEELFLRGVLGGARHVEEIDAAVKACEEAWDASYKGITACRTCMASTDPKFNEEERLLVLKFLINWSKRRKLLAKRKDECMAILCQNQAWAQTASSDTFKKFLEELPGCIEDMKKIVATASSPLVVADAPAKQRSVPPQLAAKAEEQLREALTIIHSIGNVFPRDGRSENKMDKGTQAFKLVQSAKTSLAEWQRKDYDTDPIVARLDPESWESILRFLVSMHSSGIRRPYSEPIKEVVDALGTLSEPFRRAVESTSLPWSETPGRVDLPSDAGHGDVLASKIHADDADLSGTIHEPDQLAKDFTIAFDLQSSEFKTSSLPGQPERRLSSLMRRLDR
ncbi:unnamed protein product [Effrenium voratum]|uniref:Uncharacterized protein n=1 Tax=Effrenium voratum TaxID=2562239 RepID=A0AA36HN52_9DINO|nr:unnamed protein product [Effrenium voratum]